MPLAPSLPLLGVPSNAFSRRSIAAWSDGSIPATAGAIVELTFRTAPKTPLPRYRVLSPSRSSTASCWPVDAPEGTAALPEMPEVSSTSTSTVGFPLESRISLACTRSIRVFNPSSSVKYLHTCMIRQPPAFSALRTAPVDPPPERSHEFIQLTLQVILQAGVFWL